MSAPSGAAAGPEAVQGTDALLVDDERLAAAIDSSFDTGPPLVAAAVHLGAGRRRLRRRRVARAVTSLVLLAVVGPAAAYAFGSAQGSGRDVVVPDDDLRLGTTRPYGLNQGEMVGAAAGELVLDEGVRVEQRVDNPMGSPQPAKSWGLVVSRGERREWALVEWAPMGGAVISEPPRQQFPTFRLWLDDTVAAQRGEPRLSLVRLTATGVLAPRPGVEILTQQVVAALPGGEVRGTRTAVAEVRWRGERWYVLATQEPGGEPSYLPAAASVTAPTMSGFLESLREPRGLYAVGGAQR